MKKMHWQISFWLIIIFFILSRAFFLEQIHTKALYDFDEARYAEVAKNIIRTGEWLVPVAGGPDEPRNLPYIKLSNGEILYPYFWKPPLHTLVIAIIYKLIGINELAVRLPSLLFSIGNVVLIFFIARKMFPLKVYVGYLASLIFISNNDFSVVSSQGNADAQLLFFSLLSILFAFKKTYKSIIFSGLTFGAAFMTKSFATFWIPIVFFMIIFEKDIKRLMFNILIFIISSLLIILPWHIYMILSFKDIFIQRYFLVNTIGRASGQQQNIAPLHWYLIYMLDQWKPYIFILPLFSYSLLQSLWKKHQEIVVLVVWASSIFIPFSISHSKVWWYIYPLWVPISLLLGYYFDRIIGERKIGYVISIILLSLLSILPYWQLTQFHIPIKQFIVLSGIIAFIGMLFRIIPLSFSKSFTIVISFAVCIGIGNYFPIKGAQTRTDFNRDIKVLLERNQGLNNIGIGGRAYESVLFYSNTGNITHDLSKATYIVATKNVEGTLPGFKKVDSEGYIILLKK